ncbi:SNF2 family N-terminal domain-containing protein [Hypomontagnella monticulosa]|nr:SNF2 family N-terminal domain-containing protein [Hypomontagnella monticulosa]
MARERAARKRKLVLEGNELAPVAKRPLRGQSIANHIEALSPASTPRLEEGASYHDDSFMYDSTKDHVEDTSYEVCFGVIVTTPISSANDEKEPKNFPVNIKPFGDILKLYFRDSDKYAGILNIPALCKLLEDPKTSIRLDATLHVPKSKSNAAKRKGDQSNSTSERSVRIVVYGIKSERIAIGNILSDADLYLQHPFATECDQGVEYHNPHYLVRPGGSMPRLEDLSLDGNMPAKDQSNVLDEITKSQIFRVFDSADGLGASVHTSQSPRLRSPLMPHQLQALGMMMEKERGIVERPKFPSLWVPVSNSKTTTSYRHIITGISQNNPKPINGGILADDMGLGKTMSTLALICSSLDALRGNESLLIDSAVKATLIITPKSTISGWEGQIRRHIYKGQLKTVIYHGHDRGRLSGEFRDADVVLTTYETLRSESDMKESPLYSTLWLRLVLDEAHHIRNRTSQVFAAACKVRARYRWCLTGTPIHNSLDDFGALLTFLGAYPFTQKSLFNYWIASPVKSGQSNGMRNLKDLVSATCLRRTKKTSSISLDLPERIERIEFVALHQKDRELYKFFEERISSFLISRSSSGNPRGTDELKKENIFSLITCLRLICNHGKSLLPQSALNVYENSDNASESWRMMQSYKNTCRICGEDLEESGSLDPGSTEDVGNRYVCTSCSFSYEGDSRMNNNSPSSQPSPPPEPTNIIPRPHTRSTPPSAKVEALLRNLRAEQSIRDSTKYAKSVVFTSWSKMLDLIEEAIRSSGIGWQRIDGQTSLKRRNEAIRIFNEEDDCRIMLATIGSAGEGIDFTVANHVHLVEPHWNPMVEAQAIDRVHRIGQERPVKITRYIVPKSIETYIQWVQEDKLRLIAQSIDPKSELIDHEAQRWRKLQELFKSHT